MTNLIVLGGGLVVAGAIVMTLFFCCVLPRDERRVAAESQIEAEALRAAARDAVWGATRGPDECPHDDVVEDWRPGQPRGWDESNLGAPQSSIVDQGGRCRECGVRVIRHGRPGAWTEWMLDPTRAEQ
jgi:hypothetical protein